MRGSASEGPSRVLPSPFSGGWNEGPTDGGDSSDLAPPPPPPLPEAGRTKKEQTPDEREAQLWAEARRQEKQVAVWIVLVLTVVTLYFAGLNAYVLMKEEVPPYRLAVEPPPGAAREGSYQAFVNWDPMPDEADANHPHLVLIQPDGTERTIPGLDGGEEGPGIDIGGKYEIAVRIPGNATPGTHKGSLVLEKTSGPNSLEEVLPTSVSVQVTGGFWQSWFILWAWLIVALFLLAILYIFCVITFPKPAGFLVFVDPRSASIGSKKVRLRMRRSAWIFPWLRSTLPLSWAWRKAHPRIRLRARGEIMFLFSTLPVLVLYSGQAARRFGKTTVGDDDALALGAGDFGDVGRIDLIFDTYQYCYFSPDRDDFIMFRYRKGQLGFMSS